MYRFRTIENLLGKHKELENQEIYFASPEELNDPMEGFKEVFWQGDEVVWRRLIEIYIESLERFFCLYILTDSASDLHEDRIIIGSYKANHIQQSLTNEIMNSTLRLNVIIELIRYLSDSPTAIKATELLAYFQTIHPVLLSIISTKYYENGITSHIMFRDAIKDSEKRILTLLSSLRKNFELEKDQRIIMMESLAQTMSIFKYRSDFKLYEKFETTLGKNTVVILNDFPEKFVSKLEDIIYPEWYSASFLSDNINTTIWSHYGDRHKGVCLAFKTQKENDNQFLNLNTNKYFFNKIEYHNNHVEIDFFRSLGNLPKDALIKYWYTDFRNNKSPLCNHLENNENENAWRKLYWANFQKSFSVKLKEWNTESEYRLVLPNTLKQYNEKNSRKLSYSFNDLESITFGIKTEYKAKLEIIKIIEKKCIEFSRKNFQFYQARYNKKTGKINSFLIPNLIDYK